jgi:hypothetical protein
LECCCIVVTLDSITGGGGTMQSRDSPSRCFPDWPSLTILEFLMLVEIPVGPTSRLNQWYVIWDWIQVSFVPYGHPIASPLCIYLLLGRVYIFMMWSVSGFSMLFCLSSCLSVCPL